MHFCREGIWGCVLPLQIAARLILALAKSTRMADLLENLNWKPEVRAFEAALAEATRRNGTSLCWNVGQVADASGVAKSFRAFELLAAATPDAEAFQALVEEMREADVEFTKNILLAVFAACSSVGEVGLVAELVANVNIPRSDPDICAALIRVYASGGLASLKI